MVRSALRASNHQAAYRFARCGLRADLPESGQITVHSHLQKYIPSRFPQITLITRAVSSQRGAIAIVTNAGRDAVDAAAPARDEIAGRRQTRERSQRVQTNGAAADGEVVWS